MLSGREEGLPEVAIDEVLGESPLVLEGGWGTVGRDGIGGGGGKAGVPGGSTGCACKMATGGANGLMNMTLAMEFRPGREFRPGKGFAPLMAATVEMAELD